MSRLYRNYFDSMVEAGRGDEIDDGDRWDGRRFLGDEDDRQASEVNEQQHYEESEDER